MGCGEGGGSLSLGAEKGLSTFFEFLDGGAENGLEDALPTALRTGDFRRWSWGRSGVGGGIFGGRGGGDEFSAGGGAVGEGDLGGRELEPFGEFGVDGDGVGEPFAKAGRADAGCISAEDVGAGDGEGRAGVAAGADTRGDVGEEDFGGKGKRAGSDGKVAVAGGGVGGGG